MFASQAFFARLAATAARALLFIYAITIAAQALPLKVFAMDWQISMITVITNSSILPLQGLVLAHLAAYLDPAEPRYEVFCQNLRRWALPATLGFLLFIPLQSYNLVKGIRNYRQNAAKTSAQSPKPLEISVMQSRGLQRLPIYRNVSPT